MKYGSKSLAAVAIMVASLVSAGAAHAIPFSGVFNLLSDGQGAGGPAGTVNISGTFTTNSTVTVDGFTDANNDSFDIVGLDTFVLTAVDPLPGFGTISLADSTSSTLVAILGGSTPDGVVGFFGSILNPGPASEIIFNFNGPNTPGLPTVQGTFDGSTFGLGLSGVTAVPEPSGLALLGAGLVAFGFVRRKRMGDKEISSAV